MSVSIDFKARDQEVTAAFKRIDASIRKLSGATNQLNSRLGSVNTANTAKLATHMKIAADNTSHMNTQMTRTVSLLKTAIIAATAFGVAMMSGFSLTKAGDNLTMLENRLALIVGRGKELGDVRKQLLEISKATRTTMADSTNLFGSLGLSLKDKYSTEKILGLVKSVQYATKISGQSPESSQAALVQFSQAMAGNFHGAGQELQSIAEQAPMILIAIARGMKMTTTEVRKLAAEGKLTTDMVAEALLSQKDDLARQAANIAPTVASSWSMAADAMGIYFGEVNRAIGLNAFLSRKFEAIANYFREHAETIGDTIRGLINPWARTIRDIIDYAQALWPGVQDAIMTFVNGVKDMFQELYMWLVGNSKWKDTINEIIAYAGRLWAGVKGYFLAFSDNVKKVFAGIKNYLAHTDYLTVFIQALTAIKLLFLGFMAMTTSGSAGLLYRIMFGASALNLAVMLGALPLLADGIRKLGVWLANIDQKLTGGKITTALVAIFGEDGLGGILLDMALSIKTGFVEAYDFVSGTLTDIGSGIGRFFTAVKSYDYATLVDPIKSFFLAFSNFDGTQVVFVATTAIAALFSTTIRTIFVSTLKRAFSVAMLSVFNFISVDKVLGAYVSSGFYTLYNLLLGSARRLSYGKVGEIIANLFVPSPGDTERIIPKISRAIGNALMSVGAGLGAVLIPSLFPSLSDEDAAAMVQGYATQLGAALGVALVLVFSSTIRGALWKAFKFMLGTGDSALAGFTDKLRGQFFKRFFLSIGTAFAGWNLGKLLADSLGLGQSSLIGIAVQLGSAFGAALATNAIYALVAGSAKGKAAMTVATSGGGRSKKSGGGQKSGTGMSIGGMLMNIAIGSMLSTMLVDPLIEYMTGRPLDATGELASIIATSLGLTILQGLSMPNGSTIAGNLKVGASKYAQKMVFAGVFGAIGAQMAQRMIESGGITSDAGVAAAYAANIIAAEMAGMFASHLTDMFVARLRRVDWSKFRARVATGIKRIFKSTTLLGSAVGLALAAPVARATAADYSGWEAFGVYVGISIAGALAGGIATAIATKGVSLVGQAIAMLLGPGVGAYLIANAASIGGMLAAPLAQVISVAFTGEGLVESFVGAEYKGIARFADLLIAAIGAALGAVALGFAGWAVVVAAIIGGIVYYLARVVIGKEQMQVIAQKIADAIGEAIAIAVIAVDAIKLAWTDPAEAKRMGHEFINAFFEGIKTIGTALNDWFRAQFGWGTGDPVKDGNTLNEARGRLSTAKTVRDKETAIIDFRRAEINFGSTLGATGGVGGAAYNSLSNAGQESARLADYRAQFDALNSMVTNLAMSTINTSDRGALNYLDGQIQVAQGQMEILQPKIDALQISVSSATISAGSMVMQGSPRAGQVIYVPQMAPEVDSTRRASGGFVWGAGSETSDSIPAMLSNGEFVINAKASKKFSGLLKQINSGKISKFKDGYTAGNTVQAQPQSFLDIVTGQPLVYISSEKAKEAEKDLSGARATTTRVTTTASRHETWLAERTKNNAKQLEESVWELQAALKEATVMNEDYYLQVGVDGARTMAESFKTNLSGFISGELSFKDAILGVMDTFTSQIISGFTDSFVNNIFNGLDLNTVFSNLFKGNAGLGAAAGTATGAGGGGGLFSFIGDLLGLADGGHVLGTGTGTSDSILARLSNGEFVMNAASTKRWLPLLQELNDSGGKMPKFADGGHVGAPKQLHSRNLPSRSTEQHFNINVTGDVSVQTRKEIVKMIPDIAAGVNMTNRERGNR